MSPLLRRAAPALALAFALLLPTLSAQPALAADDPTTWQVQPAGADGPDDRGAFVLAGEPGATLQDTVAVTNVSTHPITLRVLGSDAFTTSSGEFDLLPTATAPADVGSWITFAPGVLAGDGSVTIPARSRLSLPFAVAIPVDATPGDHAGGIVTSMSALGADGGQQVVVDARIASRIYLTVGGELQPRMQVSDVHATRSGPWWNPFDGSVEVSWTITNTGNVRLAGSQRVTVAGPFGWGGTTASVPDLPEVLPGGSVTQSTVIDAVPALGVIDATGSLQPVDGTGRVAEALAAVTFQTTLIAVPWIVVAAVLVLAVAAWLIVRASRRRRARMRALAAELDALRAAAEKPAAEAAHPASLTD